MKNTAELPEKEIAAHEPIHHYRIARPDIYKPIADVVKYGGIDILNPDSAEVLSGIGNTYQTSHGSYLDLDNIIYYDIKIMIKKRRRFLVRTPLLCGEKRGAALFCKNS